ncbi:hypothetical protein [Propionicicella superfundia]|uniref:hypothetical protein n=1 Tax=Propionicicella superfundia TaxID=348582 RepID=UPI000413417B|nr:hypothetical protein [Propionicicella superfundia]
MSSHETVVDDTWAWAREEDPAPPDVSAATVHVLIPGGAGAPWLASLLALCAEQTVRPVRVSVGAVPDADTPTDAAPGAGLPVETVPAASLADLWDAVSTSEAEFCWLLPAESELAPDTLERLLRTLADDGVAATGPVVSRRVSRRSDPQIEWVGATLTTTGIPVSHEGVGEVNQGQVDDPVVLGLPAAGLLVRTAVLREVGGFGTSPIPGVEVGALATLAGGRVLVTGDASLTLVGPGAGSPVASRRAGMNLAAALSRSSAGHAIGTVTGSVVGALGHVLARDPRQAGVALSALGGWLRDGAARRGLRARVASLPQTSPAAVAALRPHGARRIVDWGEGLLGALGDWLDGFSVRVESGSAIDDLTGTDATAAGGTRWRLSPTLIGFVTMLVLSVIALIPLFGLGSVTGGQLLPAPGFSELWATYLAPVAGQPGGSGPPWVAFVGLLSLVTIGNVDLAIFGTILLVVPVTWLACYRLLRHLLSEQPQAIGAAAVVALSPVLTGALNRGDVGTPVALLFVVFGALAARRLAIQPSWRWSATAALCLAVAGAIQPLLWVPSAVVGVWAAVTRRATWGKVIVALVAPLVVLAPWAPTLWRWPGRLLTGPEPALASAAAPDAWALLGRDGGAGLPPVWVSIAIVGGLWLIAIVGLIRVGRRSWAGWGVAALGLAGVVVLGKIVVDVPPGVSVRPAVTFWLTLFVSGLALAAALGGDRVVSDLRDSALGWRQVVVAPLSVLAAVVAVLGAGWWVVGGASDLRRDDLTSTPPYVANAQAGQDPGRTLAISLSGEGDRQASWALLESDLPRLGDGERGVAAGGSATAAGQAAGVVTRLLAGTADDLLLPDLRSLGVAYIWVRDADETELANIGNTPGLGVGSGDESTWVWPVPDSARAVVVSGSDVVVAGNGSTIAAGAADRELILSEPADPRWEATVGGEELSPSPVADWRQRFAVPKAGGELAYRLRGSSWWAWLQAAALVVWLVMVAPAGARQSTVGARGGVS